MSSIALHYEGIHSPLQSMASQNNTKISMPAVVKTPAKKRRRQTRSCFNCRKRKTRCTYRPEYQSACEECFQRGVTCTIQDAAETATMTTKNRKSNLRERVSILESLVATMRKDLKESKNLLDAYTAHHSTAPIQPLFTRDCTSKEFQMAQALKSLLPGEKSMNLALEKADMVWNSRQSEETRLFGPRQPFIAFKDFATHAFRHGSVYEMGEVAQILATVTTNLSADRILLVVDRFVIFDDDYMASSLDGIRCAIRQGFLYSNYGQTFSAWRTFRRAILCVQLQGLHQNRKSLEDENLWWALYSLDRCFSLIICVPYAISEENCNTQFNGGPLEEDNSLEGFLLRLSQITAKVLDHLQGNASPTVLELGRELTCLVLELTLKSDQSSTSQHKSEAVIWKETLLCSLNLYQIDVALHLPYLLKFPTDVVFEPLRNRCVQASREFLRAYHQFRHASNSFATSCRIYDSVACSTVMVLLLSVWGYGKAEKNFENEEENWQLIEKSMELFRCTSARAGEHVAVQSYRVLQQLKESQSLDTTRSVIPFFGKRSISRREILRLKDTSISKAIEDPVELIPVVQQEPQEQVTRARRIHTIDLETETSRMGQHYSGQLIPEWIALRDGSESWERETIGNDLIWDLGVGSMSVESTVFSPPVDGWLPSTSVEMPQMINHVETQLVSR